MSNFLGDVGIPQGTTSIISANELIAREGVELQKGMNFRDKEDKLSVFLVLPRASGFTDGWNEEAGLYEYEGHDSTTVEGGKSADQLMMYPSGTLTENGKFLKAANEFHDGVRKEPLQVQIYEKLDPGVWYDKGIFNLVEARFTPVGGRKVFKFYLSLADADFYSSDDPDRIERLLSATQKGQVWHRDGGRCVVCALQSGLHFVAVSGSGLQLRCAAHGGKLGGGLLG